MNLRTHLKMAAGSLAIACVLWLGVHNEDRITIPLTVRVNFDLGEGIVKMNDPIDVVVRVRANRNRLATVRSSDVTVSVDNLAGFVGTRLELLDGAIETPFGVEIDSVEPARIQVEYDRLETASIPVAVQWEGEPADGWRVDEEATRAEPPRVQVSGPSKLLAALESIPTVPVAIEGASEGVRANAIVLQPPDARLALTDTVSVVAIVSIVPQIGTLPFPDIPITVVRGEWETSPPNPPRLEVRIQGPLPALRRLPLTAIRLSVDMRERQPREKDYRVEVNHGIDHSLCPGCTILRLSPQSAVDVAVRGRKRNPVTPSPTPATAATTSMQDSSDAQAAGPESARAPAGEGGTPDEPGRTG